ncbi:carbon-nitrogen hydrolase family protein [Caminibacter mediatlanticus TB-2]|uniref:Carbon-nitrogen hydrolase family protein n=1 Tax=Caminibacter mediatlanticus TB-2 TaxID=391592 RepID=A0ABX5V9M1_9BACT|nr:carbon-nitrogen hydrolase family protein [Caminibacter mediatlanticus]QCT93765.1 carbon-nitrogen hydrolase family protein [Caminibacter mediatlanticus TB-2]
MKSEKLKVEVVNFKTSIDYEYNLKQVIKIITNSSADFLLFPEVCLTGFDYKNFKKANEFSKFAINELKKLNRAFALTIIEDNKNYFYFFDKKKVIHKRAKYNLFGEEKEHFVVGEKPDIFEWRGLKIANLICFELRFIEYWEKFKGADLILVPARWGKERIEHFKTLNKALALSTQSQVICCNSANEKSYGAILDGWGEGVEVTSFSGITQLDLEKNNKIRKKLDIGIK